MNKLPQGCDYQGRHPEAAEAATEIGADDGPEALGRVVVFGAVVIAIIAVVAFIAGYYS